MAGIFALSQFEELPLAQLLQSFDGLVLLIFVPAIFWDAFCRVSPRPVTKLESISSWILRCWILYFWAFLLAFFAVGLLAGVGPLRWSNGSWDDTITPEIRAMYFERGMTFALSIIIASAVLVSYDRWRARSKSTDITKR